MQRFKWTCECSVWTSLALATFELETDHVFYYKCISCVCLIACTKNMFVQKSSHYKYNVHQHAYTTDKRPQHTQTHTPTMLSMEVLSGSRLWIIQCSSFLLLLFYVGSCWNRKHKSVTDNTHTHTQSDAQMLIWLCLCEAIDHTTILALYYHAFYRQFFWKYKIQSLEEYIQMTWELGTWASPSHKHTHKKTTFSNFGKCQSTYTLCFRQIDYLLNVIFKSDVQARDVFLLSIHVYLKNKTGCLFLL